MASIFKRKTKYSVVYSYIDETGAKKQRWETFGSLKEAKKRKAEVEFQQSTNTFTPPSIKTVADLMRDFVDLYGVNSWAISTFESKRGLIDNYILPFLGDMRLDEVTPRVIDEFYKKLQSTKCVKTKFHPNVDAFVSPRNILEIHKILRSAFNQAVKWELISRNPVVNATLPKSEPKRRDIWTADELFHALSLCESDILALAINLSFSCSLRMGELLGLTWDCVDISDEAIESGNASIRVEKELQRVSRNAMQTLSEKDVIMTFPSLLANTTTQLVLKKPKTKTSVRRVWLPRTVAVMLRETKRGQEEMQEILGSEYTDYNLVMAMVNGKPIEQNYLSRLFRELISKNNLRPVVFHSIRHTSTTYKLKLNGGDVKAVQGDTGHAQSKMVMDTYSHILDEDRRDNAAMFEQMFYRRNYGERPEEAAPITDSGCVKEKEHPSPAPDLSSIMELLSKSPELADELYKLLGSRK